MKILILSNPITNAGDHLFTKKLIEIITKLCSHAAEITFKNGLKVITLEEANKYDQIIIGGGPLYDNRMMNSNNLAIMKIIKDITAKINIIGAGWYGRSYNPRELYEYRFDDEIIENLQYIEAKGGILGTRDTATTTVLKNNGLTNVVLTGCPVWYDFDKINILKSKISTLKDAKKIIISDPGITKDPALHESMAEQTIQVINYVKERFSNAELIFTFNNGIYTKYSTPCNVTIMEHCNKIGMTYIDISGNFDGFSNYDNADLHIGYRMHSHIYALSKRIPSILIEEDARGFGFNNSVGLNNITAYDVNNFENRNPYVIKQLDNSLNEYEANNFYNVEKSFEIMKYTWDHVVVGIGEFLLRK